MIPFTDRKCFYFIKYYITLIIIGVVKVICINERGEAVSLNSIQQAADKAISLMDKSNAVVARKHRDRVEKRIKKAARTNKTYIDCKWEVFFEQK